MASTPLRLALVAAATALLLALPAAPARGERGIVGGQATTVTQAPWQVALIDTSHYGFPIQFCGGSILDERHVLTAAHCVAEPESFTPDVIYAATTLLSDPQQIVAVTSSRTHPAYGASGSASDVAVLTLSTPIELDGVDARAAELASDPTPAGTAVTVSGWGDMSNGEGFYPNQLRAVTVHAVSDQACASSYGAALAPVVMLCAGEPGGAKDSCAGDSGGPLVEAGTDVLVGVVSFGYQCALAGYPGVYAEVAAASIRSFVEGALSDQPPVVDPPQPDPIPTAPIAVPPSTPAQPAAAPADTTAPVAAVQASNCTRSACTLLIRVTDAGVSAGIHGVEASLRSRQSGTCRLRGGRLTPCTRTSAPRSLRAVATAPGSFKLRVARLPTGASHRFALVASDSAGHRQAVPTVVRLTTRPSARQQALRRARSLRRNRQEKSTFMK